MMIRKKVLRRGKDKRRVPVTTVTCYGWKWEPPPHLYVNVLTPRASECDLTQRQSLYRGCHVRMKSLSWTLIQFVHVCMLSCVWLFVTPWTVACQAPLSTGFSRQEYWSGLPFASPGTVLSQGSNPCLLLCRWILHCWAIREARNPVWLISSLGEIWTWAFTEGKPYKETQGEDSYSQGKERGLEQILPTQPAEITNPANTLILNI